jgi:hypothetical protein
VRYGLFATSFAALALWAAAAPAQDATKKNLITAPSPQEWADLAKLPDWSGVWNPRITDQDAQIRTNMPPWTPKAAAQIAHMMAEGMPAWMLVTHNSLEFLFTPGQVTILGESDGNRLRRIYTDGRAHPEDPDPSFHGHSIGHWEGDTLVVDTVGVLPQVYIAISEAAGMPNNGDMHIIERIHLAGPDVLNDDLEIIAPKVLTKPWKTTRVFSRQRSRKYEIVEGVCIQGSFSERVDADGNAIFVIQPHQPWGNMVAPK